MKLFDETAFETALQAGDRNTVGRYLTALSGWVVSTAVHYPNWMDKGDLVQMGVEYCLKALPSSRIPRMPYLVQVVKWEVWHQVNRTCRKSQTPVEVDEGEEDRDMDELAETVARSRAAGAFPEVAEALIAQYRTGHATTAKEFIASDYGKANPAMVREFLSQLREEL